MFDKMCNILFCAGCRCCFCSFPQQSESSGCIWCRMCFRFEVAWSGIVTLCSLGLTLEEQQHSQATRRCPWCISAHLSPSIWPWRASCAQASAHVIWHCQQPVLAMPIHLPCCQYMINILGQAPLIPCFIDCNTHPTVPYKFLLSRRLGTESAYT